MNLTAELAAAAQLGSVTSQDVLGFEWRTPEGSRYVRDALHWFSTFLLTTPDPYEDAAGGTKQLLSHFGLGTSLGAYPKPVGLGTLSSQCERAASLGRQVADHLHFTEEGTNGGVISAFMQIPLHMPVMTTGKKNSTGSGYKSYGVEDVPLLIPRGDMLWDYLSNQDYAQAVYLCIASIAASCAAYRCWAHVAFTRGVLV